MPNFTFSDFSPGTNLLANPLSTNDNSKSLEWADSENVELQGLNGIKKMKGNSVFLNLSAITGKECKILAVSEFKKVNLKLFAFVYSDDTQAYLCVTPVGSTEYKVVKRGLAKEAQYNLTPYNKSIIVSNGKQNSFIYFYDEVPEIVTCRTFEAHGIYPTDVKSFRGRLYAFTSVKDREGILYYSALDNPAEWSAEKGGGLFADIIGVDKPIRALGEYGDALAIHRDKQTILLTGNSEQDWLTTPFSDMGSLSPRGVVNYDNRQYFYDEGIYALQYSSLQQIQLSSEFSRPISPSFQAMYPENFKHLIALAYPPERQVWFFMSEGDSPTDELDIVWIMDRKNKNVAWYKRRALPVLCACLCDNKIYTGTSDGRILIENTTDRLCGEPFEGFWNSMWLKFGTLQYKSVENSLDIAFGIEQTNVTVEYRFNMNPSRVRNRTVSLPPTKPVKRFNVPGIFKSLQIGVRSTSNFSINSLIFYEVSLEE